METNQTEECECGGKVEDHEEIEIDFGTEDYHIEVVCHHKVGCVCDQYYPKDATYYADLDYDARAEKWERSRE